MLRRAVICGTGRAAPAKVLGNDDLEKMVDTNDAWIVERTGIRQRRIAPADLPASDLALAASRSALESAGLGAADLDMILVATVTPDRLLPSAGAILQRKLGATCPAVDVVAACAGFLYALAFARGQVESGAARRVLVVGVEVLSRWVDWTDRNTCVLFGDGAGAVLVAAGEDPERGIVATRLAADGRLADALYVEAGGTEVPPTPETLAAGRHHIKMNGREIYKHAVKNLAEISEAVIADAGWTRDQVDWVIPHQANLRILEAVSKRLEVPMEKFFINLDRYGNTSSASVPMALDEASRKGLLKPGQRLVFAALGAGLTWGAAAVRW